MSTDAVEEWLHTWERYSVVSRVWSVRVGHGGCTSLCDGAESSPSTGNPDTHLFRDSLDQGSGECRSGGGMVVHGRGISGV